MWKTEKGKGKARDTRDSGRLQSKGNFKTDLRKAMITIWGEYESDDENENTKEEETTKICHMEKNERKRIYRAKRKKEIDLKISDKNQIRLNKTKNYECKRNKIDLW